MEEKEVKAEKKVTTKKAEKVANKEVVKKAVKTEENTKTLSDKTAIAELRHARISARKVKIVIDLIRGKNVKESIAILKYTNKAAAPLVEKLVKSAIANAVNNNHMDETKLTISEIYANQGPTMKRIMPAAQGKANRIRKRTSHIKVVLKEA